MVSLQLISELKRVDTLIHKDEKGQKSWTSQQKSAGRVQYEELPVQCNQTSGSGVPNGTKGSVEHTMYPNKCFWGQFLATRSQSFSIFLEWDKRNHDTWIEFSDGPRFCATCGELYLARLPGIEKGSHTSNERTHDSAFVSLALRTLFSRLDRLRCPELCGPILPSVALVLLQYTLEWRRRTFGVYLSLQVVHSERTVTYSTEYCVLLTWKAGHAWTMSFCERSEAEGGGRRIKVDLKFAAAWLFPVYSFLFAFCFFGSLRCACLSLLVLKFPNVYSKIPIFLLSSLYREVD